MRPINIAIDGYAGCGKSTLARELAAALDYIFIDTGALYRAITFLTISQEGGNLEQNASKAIAGKPELAFDSENNHILINGTDCESQIRDMKVVAQVSEVAAIPAVRNYLKGVQKALVEKKGVVMEGRDIGTVIMPDAELKLFITASIEARLHRRLNQLKQEGKPSTEQEVKENLLHRDHIDANREVAPLAKASDAITIDTTELSREEQLKFTVAIAKPLIEPNRLLPHVL
ncbi:MAG: (d)CMP kinase [Flavobacteriales bacterium]